VTARRVALAATFVSAVLCRFDHGAVAAGPRLRVLIVVDESDDPFAERIKAEVSALGLEVVAVEPWRTGETVESLDAAGRAHQAAAAIRMVASRKGVEVWMANQPTGRSLLRQLVVDERAGAPNEGLVALQTAELLRTTLLSRSEVPGTSSGGAAARGAPAASLSQISAPAPAPSAASTGLQAAAGALYSPGAGNPAIQAWLTLNRVIVGRVGLSLDMSAPLYPGTLSGPEGSASVGAWLAGAAAFVRYERPDGHVYATVAMGAAVIRVNAEGTTNAPFVGTTESTTAGAGYVRLDGGVEIARWLRFGGRAVAGAVPSGVTVRFAGNEAAVWGRPFLGGLLFADLAW
jgi:hypothetical protein